MERCEDASVEGRRIKMGEEPTDKSNMNVNDADSLEDNVIQLSKVCEEFVTKLIDGTVAKSDTFFEEWFQEWNEYFSDDEEYDTEILRAIVLLDIESRLNERGKNLASYNLPSVTREQREHLVNQGYSGRGISLACGTLEMPRTEICEEIPKANVGLGPIDDDPCAHFTSLQREVFEEVMEAVESGQGRCIFVDARCGRMKLDLLNAILAAVKDVDGNSIALAASSRQRASHLLLGGKTFHSLFHADFNVREDSELQIYSESAKAMLINEAKLIVVDEAVSLHKWHIEALDRKLREITGLEKVFGNKVVVLAGDFKQLLPVYGGSTSIERFDSVINRSCLWSKFKVFPLIGGERINSVEKTDIFEAWLRHLGNGDLPSVTATDPNQKDIKLPHCMCIEIQPQNREKSFLKLITFVFRSFDENTSKCAILAPTDKYVQTINDFCTVLMPGRIETCLSEDSHTECTCLLGSPGECPSSRKISGLPPHRLLLKRGIPLILLQTIPLEGGGISTGTRLTLKQALDDHLVCTVDCGREVLIPRMPFSSSHRNPQSVDWVRCQFPVQVAFATTIHKSQGMMLERAGVWLEEDVFTHGQLYTAASCVERMEDIKFALRKRDHPPFYVTRNVVCKRVFNDSNDPSPKKKKKIHVE